MVQAVQVGGSADLAGFRFRTASFQESLSDVSIATVVVVSETGDDLTESILGKTLSLSWPLGRNDESRHFNGVVGRYALTSINEGGRAAYQITLYSWNWLLTKNATFRIFQNKSIPEIIEEVFGKYSHSSVRFENRLSESYSNWEYCVQYRETDFNFVSRLMEQLGIYYYFLHTDKDHTLVLCDGPSAHQAFPGYGTLPFHPTRGQGRALEEEHVASLSYSKEIRTKTFAGADYWFKEPKKRVFFEADASSPDFVKEYEYFDYPLEVDDSDHGQYTAKVRSEAQATSAIRFEGTSNCAALSPGHLLTVDQHDLTELQPQLLITSVVIQIREADVQSGSHETAHLSAQFEAIPSEQPFRPERKTPKPLVEGPQSGLVVGRKGDEIYTDQYGRVKVHFYWDRDSKQDENSSCWIRVASPFAGRGWGFIAIPRVGDEVLVQFECGDPDRPVIVGSMYNHDQITPYPLEAEANCVGLRSRSTKSGGVDNFNELRFDDTKGNEYVWLQAEKNMNALVKNNKYEEIRADNHLHIEGNSTSRVEGDTDHGIGGDLTSQVDGDAHYTVSQDLIAKIESLLSAAVNGSASVKVADKTSIESGSNIEIKSGSDVNSASGTATNLNAGTQINIQAGVKISLSVGGSFISISPSGIDISGPMVNVNTGGSAAKADKASPSAPEAPPSPEEPEEPQDPIPAR